MSNDNSHISLRAIEPADLDAMLAVDNDVSLWYCSASNAPFSRRSLEEFLYTTQFDFYSDKQLRLTVQNTSGEALGFVDLSDYNAQFQRAEVGIALMDSQRGKGIGEKALVALLQYVRQHLHLHQVYAIVAADNHAAQHIFEGSGFMRTATMRDWCMCPGNANAYCDAVLYQYIFR